MKTIAHKFVEYIPEALESDIIYISINYKTAVHSCICGCGNRVVTPITPTDWNITFNGQSVSLYPSIGNWNFECKSHYWIKNNKIKHAPKWGYDEIEKGRTIDKKKKRKYSKKNFFVRLFSFLF